jgi:hypothetical protein
MKFLFILGLFISAIAYAGVQPVIRDASVTAIPSTYAGTDGLLMSGVEANKICCINHTGSAIGLCLRANGAAACGDDWYLEDADGFCFDEHPLANSVFIRGWGGAVSSGIFACRVWLRN